MLGAVCAGSCECWELYVLDKRMNIELSLSLCICQGRERKTWGLLHKIGTRYMTLLSVRRDSYICENRLIHM